MPHRLFPTLALCACGHDLGWVHGVYDGGGTTCEQDPALDMVTIPAGTFTMGSPADETGRNDGDFAAHEAAIARPFCTGATEVTYDQFIAWGGQEQPGWPALCRGDCPMHNISWYEAAWVATLLSAAEGLEPCFDCYEGEDGFTWCDPLFDEDPSACAGYRLPTEAEWEYAARAGSTHAFWNEADLPEGYDYTYSPVCDPGLTLTNGDLLADLGVFCGVDSARPHPVAERRANPWGLYDVVGNVHEWVHDAYDDPPQRNHWGVVGLLKGGAFGYSAGDQRAAFRMGATRVVHWDYGGVRFVRTAPEE
jgi:formylglycine-generating enzyme required for sulfatase activity